MNGTRSGLRFALGAVFLLVFCGLLAYLVRRAPEDVFSHLRAADPVPILFGTGIYSLAYVARAVRFNLLLKPSERIPLGRGVAVSGATTFLLQVLPFRAGEVASWAAYRRVLGVGWARAGAVFVLVKVVDSAATLLVGLAGAARIAFRHDTPVLGGTTAALVAAGALALLVGPWLGVSFLSCLHPRLREGSRLERGMKELAEGLGVGRRNPGAYGLACLFSVAFLAGHVAAIQLMLRGLGIVSPPSALAFATLTSVLSAALILSPVGSFGSMESGFAAGLALDGVPIVLGTLGGAAVHLITAATAGLLGLPFFLAQRPARPLDLDG